MAHWENVEVAPDFQGGSRLERQGGRYRRYHPDLLTDCSNALSSELTEYAADVTVALTKLGATLRANPLPILYSTSVRSESIASSWIEGIRETPRAIAVAQIADQAASHAAGQVVRNVSAMRQAMELLGHGRWEQQHIFDIHQGLLPRATHGYRTGQVWIGGDHPLNAEYAAPPHPLVKGFMDDLLAYANTSGDLPVVQAAIIHAQFETIHPFSDGNGRVGRALVHGLLKRAGLVDEGVVPLSNALRKDVPGYVKALTHYRYDGDARQPALEAYVRKFFSYLAVAASSATRFAAAAVATHQRWQHAVSGVRADSSLRRAVDLVIEYPVVSAPFVARELQVSTMTAGNLIKQLTDVGILKAATGKYRRAALYQADEVLNLLAFEDQMAPEIFSSAQETPGAQPVLIHRCGASTPRGDCRNRVPTAGARCWRHDANRPTTA